MTTELDIARLARWVTVGTLTHHAGASGAAGRSPTFAKTWQQLFDPRDPRPVKSIVNRRSP